MRNHLLHIAVLLSLLGLASCKDRMPVEENDGKSPIRLAVGGVDIPDTELTRAVITDGTGKTLRAFTGTTRLFFAMVAEHADGSQPKLYGFNYGTAAAVADPTVGSKSDVTFPNNYLYWDDAYARDTKVSVYSIAVANQVRGNVILGRTSGTTITIGTEGSGAKEMIPFANPMPVDPVFNWQLGEPDGGSAFRQTKTIFDWADLVFSNNIADYSSVSKPDNRLKFHTESGEMYHKFDKGELIYYHALTQLTIKIKCGDGFKGDGTDFKFTNTIGGADNSFALNGFYGANGVFEIVNGEFLAMTDANLRNWTSIYLSNTTEQKKEDGAYYTLNAYVFPGTDMSTGSIDNMFSFVIDGNRYDISREQLYTALQTANPSTMGSILDAGKLKAGYNYEFTFTVEKSKISGFTAQVVDWESVTADNIDPTNARISLVLEERGTYVDAGVDFYRAKDPDNTIVTDTYEGYVWKTGYNTDGKATGTTCTDHKWSTPNWFWPDNTTFYHFRALSPTTQAITTESTNGDFTTLAHGETYTDVTWGAPFLDDAADEIAGTFKLYYNTTSGFDATGTGSPSAAHQIYKGIGPTADVIKLLMFHMMSDVTINVTTTADTEPNHVELGDGTDANHTTIRLENIHKAGKVLMGNGLVSGTDVVSNYTFTAHPAPTGEGKVIWANYGAIPQDLTNVVLVITTPDKNEYRVSMKDVKATTVPTTNNLANPYSKVGGTGADKDKYLIDQWYPSYKYTYSFKLTKKGIESLQATILDWEDVVADEEEVQIQ